MQFVFNSNSNFNFVLCILLYYAAYIFNFEIIMHVFKEACETCFGSHYVKLTALGFV